MEKSFRVKLDYILSPEKGFENITLTDLMDSKNIQHIQDAFAKATDVSSVITDTDGNSITEASNFLSICHIIKNSETGKKKCMNFRKLLGKKSAKLMKPLSRNCPACGLTIASAPIIVAGQHIANWFIGQKNTMEIDIKKLEEYASEINVSPDEMLDACNSNITMSYEKFEEVLDLLWYFARDISTLSYNNLKLVREIAEGKKSEKELRFHSNILNEIRDSVTVTDPEGYITYINKANLDNLGFSREDVVGKHVKIFGESGAYGATQNEILEKTLKIGRWRGEVVNYDKEGKEHIFDVRTSLLKGEEGEVPNLIGIATDITGIKKVERALRDSEERYRQVISSIHHIVWKCDFDKEGRYLNTYISPVGDKMLGLKPGTIGNSWDRYFSFVHPEDFPLLLKALSDGAQYPGRTIGVEYRMIKPDGHTIWFHSLGSASVNSNGIVQGYGTTTDITEQKKSEEEKRELELRLRQALKMEAIGTLAGGIAHDFNNILGAIIGYTELAMGDLSENTITYANMANVINASRRAKELIREILTFCRRTGEDKKLIKLDIVLNEAFKLLRASLPSSIKLKLSIKADYTSVMANPTQMHQVIMNLCTNAAQAMEKKSGVLEIGLCNFKVRDEEESVYQGIIRGDYLKLSVRDTGRGMEKRILERIFDPYFTTKEVGEGSGLGLSVVHGIIESHGGIISVESSKGKGTSFHIFLPVAEAEPDEEYKREKKIESGTEEILFVDDEEDLVYVTKLRLERLGYRVFATTKSKDALSVFLDEPNRFDAVITDQTMPEISGNMLAKEILSVRPDIPIILCTGFSEVITPEEAAALGIKEFVMKPFDIEEIAVLIRKVLSK